MHLLEKYALSTASKIGQPFIFKKFFPIPFDKYITIQNSNEVPGKVYDYFQEIVNFIYKDLEKLGYKIIQIGSKNDTPINNVYNLQGQLNINQTAFILENSKLHIDNNSFSTHICNAFNTPLISLYGISSPETTGPFWKKNNQICLTPSNWKPSLNPNENPKKINEILIESIIESINNLLKFNINSIKTKYIGEKYKHGILETIPEQVLHPQSFEKHLLNIRFDFLNREFEQKDYQGTIQNLNIRQCCIVTNKPLLIENFINFKNNLPIIIYDITNELDINFIEKMTSLGFNNNCIFKVDNSSEEKLNFYKEQLIDFPQIIEEVRSPKIDLNLLNNKSLFYKTNKLFIANNNVYLGKYGYLNNDPIVEEIGIKSQKIINNEFLSEFIKNDLEYSFIFENN